MDNLKLRYFPSRKLCPSSKTENIQKGIKSRKIMMKKLDTNSIKIMRKIISKKIIGIYNRIWRVLKIKKLMSKNYQD